MTVSYPVRHRIITLADVIGIASNDCVFEHALGSQWLQLRKQLRRRQRDPRATVFDGVTQLIRRKLREGDEVIVHCWAGQQRSAAVMAAYLMKYAHMSKEHAMRFIRRQKPDAFSWGATFDPALESWDNNMV